MDTCIFNDHYLNHLLEKRLKKNAKKIFLFNISLLKFDPSENNL